MVIKIKSESNQLVFTVSGLSCVSDTNICTLVHNIEHSVTTDKQKLEHSWLKRISRLVFWP